MSFSSYFAVIFAVITYPADAKVVDFNLPTSEQGAYVQDNFNISAGYNGSERIDWSSTFGNLTKLHLKEYNANFDNATIVTRYADLDVSIMKTDGSTFNLNNISLADAFNSKDGGVVDFKFVYEHYRIERESVELQKITGLQSFVFNKRDLIAFSFTPKTTYKKMIQFDFLRFDEAIASSLPEPSTWAFMLIGFGVIGYSMRRTRVRSMRMQAV